MILVLVLLVLVIFLLSNRDAVAFGFWPFPMVVALPLGAVILAALALGFVLGILFHLPRRLGANRRAKRAEKRNAELEARLAVPPPIP